MPNVGLREAIILVKRLGAEPEGRNLPAILRLVNEQARSYEGLENWPMTAGAMALLGAVLLIAGGLMQGWKSPVALAGGFAVILGAVSFGLFSRPKNVTRSELESLAELRAAAIQAVVVTAKRSLSKPLDQDQKKILKALVKKTRCTDLEVLRLLER